ncbi:MAG: glycosyltransferase family 2 protein [Betaproteobacteria bacterium]|nr:glycosyltransferase family 2 protein [Betaproteobacteria bacterium]
MPQVDVIIPVYNTPDAYTREALDSALAQTFRDIRVVVVNDGSGEACTAALEALIASRDDPRIRYCKSHNRGLAGARNFGIASSDSPFIALLDSDDAWYPHKIERQLELFDLHPAADLIFLSSDLQYGADVAGLRRIPPQPYGVNELGPVRACQRMLRGNFVSVNTTMFRRAAAAEVGFFDEQCRTLEDKDLWIRMLLKGKRFLHFPEVVAIYRIHPSSLSRNPEKMRDGRLRIIGKMDSLVGTGVEWIDRDWPGLRREMLHHAYHEASETYMETGQYLKALWSVMPWHAGFSGRSARLAAKAALRTLGLNRGRERIAS